jgi:hypothetical protein
MLEGILDDSRMRTVYGQFFSQSSQVDFNSEDVLHSLRVLIPYARFWGLTDDVRRELLVKSAPLLIRKNLKEVVARFDDNLDEWLAGEEAHARNPSNAYLAFSSMRMAADFL